MGGWVDGVEVRKKREDTQAGTHAKTLTTDVVEVGPKAFVLRKHERTGLDMGRGPVFIAWVLSHLILAGVALQGEAGGLDGGGVRVTFLRGRGKDGGLFFVYLRG